MGPYMKRTDARRATRALTVILAVSLLGGANAGLPYLRTYFIARYHGEESDLHNCNLIHAPLSGVNLGSANLHHATLSGALLRGADLDGANLGDAVAKGAD